MKYNVKDIAKKLLKEIEHFYNNRELPREVKFLNLMQEAQKTLFDIYNHYPEYDVDHKISSLINDFTPFGYIKLLKEAIEGLPETPEVPDTNTMISDLVEYHGYDDAWDGDYFEYAITHDELVKQGLEREKED